MRKKYTNFIIEKATGEFLAKLIRKTHDVLGDHPESIYIHEIE